MRFMHQPSSAPGKEEESFNWKKFLWWGIGLSIAGFLVVDLTRWTVLNLLGLPTV
jgi:hypothetical protein